jgi:hypothetical protein
VQGGDEQARPKPSSLIFYFVGHVWLGAIGFIALAIPAVFLSISAHYLEIFPVSPFVVDVLLGIHYLLLVVDATYFVYYIMVSTYDALRKLTRYMRGL